MKWMGTLPIKGCISWQNLTMHACKFCPSPIPAALLFIMVLFLAGSQPVLAGPEASVRKIVAGREQNQRTGTGFYIHPNILATSFHVIQGAKTITAEMDEGKVRIKSLLAFDADLDWALLYTPIRGASLPLGGEFLQPWTKLQTLGFSQGKSMQKIT
ncbi:MAG: trypsin-like peptidase domain-containing protein, partial [Desulfovermiculus sp.]|nr:trypsin-like peptidase domain-containing protein [Desulfovermiculus sp.]